MHRCPTRFRSLAARPWLRAALAGGLAAHLLHFLLPLVADGWLGTQAKAHHHRGTLGLVLGIAPLVLGGAALAWPHVRRRVLIARW